MTSHDTVLLKNKCLCCRELVECTIGAALGQSNYAGLDYEDGGEGGAIQCENEECAGMYITDLCSGKPSLDSGKFHNHCTECPDFGICICDYRNAHCGGCGDHYFQGMSGFACPSCGAGSYGVSKSKNIAELPPPSPSTWNGVIEGTITSPRQASIKYMASNMRPQGPSGNGEGWGGCSSSRCCASY
jgi:hypothetical protein